MHTKYFRIADITIVVRSELPIKEDTFHPKFRQFEVDGPGDDMVVIDHHFSGIPDIPVLPEDRVYFKPPWAIYKKNDNLVYEWIEAEPPHANYYRKVITNKRHSNLEIYNDEKIRKKFEEGNLDSLSALPTDQIFLGPLLAYREGALIHSLGVILNEKGYLFVGHSGAGKSTMAEMLKKEAEILCDDRNIIRLLDNEMKLYGTWSHGDVPDISSRSAVMGGIFFLEQSEENKIVGIKDTGLIVKKLLACLIRSMVTPEWWNYTIDIIVKIAKSIPCFDLKFDKSGNVLELLTNFRKTQG